MLTPAMYSTLEDLKLDRLDVVYPGDRTFPLRERIRALGPSCLFEDLEPLRHAS